MTNINDDYSAKLPEGAIATANADNALATVTKAAEAGKAHYVTGVSGGYSAAVAGGLLVLKDGITEIGRWYIHNALDLSFADAPLKCTPGSAVSAELSASGTLGVIGAVNLTLYTSS